jgi:lipid II:glycine glycyltransferase (peptidoglycan interpeptide bridge formation enzyme)
VIDARTCEERDRDAFDAYVASSPTGDLLQSWEWGEIKQTNGWEPIRYVAEEGGRIVAAVSVLRRRPFPFGPPLLYAPRGPVFDDARALGGLLARVRRDAGRAFLLKCDPAVAADSLETAALHRAGFRGARAGGIGAVQPPAVMTLDLRPDEDTLFARFKPKWRYNVRLAERRGVEVVEAGGDELPTFFALLVETARRDRFPLRGQRYFETQWNALARRGMVRMWLARYAGRVIAGAMCFVFGARVTYMYGASANAHREVMPNHLVQWTMIRWAKACGAAVYDLRGVSAIRDGKPVEPSNVGLNRFKEGFGARYVEYVGDLELPLRPVMWRAWTTAVPAATAMYRRLLGGLPA